MWEKQARRNNNIIILSLKIFNDCRGIFQPVTGQNRIDNIPIVDKHIENLTTQYIDTCKSVYAKGDALFEY